MCFSCALSARPASFPASLTHSRVQSQGVHHLFTPFTHTLPTIQCWAAQLSTVFITIDRSPINKYKQMLICVVMLEKVLPDWAVAAAQQSSYVVILTDVLYSLFVAYLLLKWVGLILHVPSSWYVDTCFILSCFQCFCSYFYKTWFIWRHFGLYLLHKFAATETTGISDCLKCYEVGSFCSHWLLN